MRLLVIALIVAVAGTLVEVLHVKHALVQEHSSEPAPFGNEKIFIAAMHWNSEWILREAWISALVDLVNAIGRENVFVSIQESGSYDNTKDAIRLLDGLLAQGDIPRRIIMDDTSHHDEITKPPGPTGWIQTPIGTVEMRRVPFLSKLRNLVMQPLYDMQNAGIVFDKVLLLNDVVFNVSII